MHASYYKHEKQNLRFELYFRMSKVKTWKTWILFNFAPFCEGRSGRDSNTFRSNIDMSVGALNMADLRLLKYNKIIDSVLVNQPRDWKTFEVHFHFFEIDFWKFLIFWHFLLWRGLFERRYRPLGVRYRTVQKLAPENRRIMISGRVRLSN